MSARPFPLETVEAWMQEVLAHPEGVDAGLSSPAASALIPPERAGAVVRKAGPLSVVDRLGIYAGMYPLRMREALETDYPALAWLMGDSFEDLVRDYVTACPSTSFTLARLGDRLPEFVSHRVPPSRRALLGDVARLERAASTVFDAPESPTMSTADLEDAPDLGGTVFHAVPALALLRVRPGAVEALDSFLEEGRPPRGPGRGTAWVVYHRQDFTVLRRTLDPFSGRLLERFVAGETLSDALAAVSGRGVRPVPEALSASIWEWISLGFFRAPYPAAPRGTLM